MISRRAATLSLLTLTVPIGASVQGCGRKPYAASRVPVDEVLEVRLVKNCENAVAAEVHDNLKDATYASSRPRIEGDRISIAGRLSGPSGDAGHTSIPYTCEFKRIGDSWQLEGRPIIR